MAENDLKGNLHCKYVLIEQLIVGWLIIFMLAKHFR